MRFPHLHVWMYLLVISRNGGVNKLNLCNYKHTLACPSWKRNTLNRYNACNSVTSLPSCKIRMQNIFLAGNGWKSNQNKSCMFDWLLFNITETKFASQGHQKYVKLCPQIPRTRDESNFNTLTGKTEEMYINTKYP